MAAPKKIAKGRAHSATASTEHQETYLFVYGTLMRSQKSHRELTRNQNIHFEGSAKIQGELYEFHNVDYPGAIPSTGPDRFVHGELYVLRAPEGALQALDAFEGCTEGLFRRAMATAWIDGREVKAWAYFYARSLEEADLVPGGRYRPALSEFIVESSG